MIPHIELHAVLQESLGFADLVTRPTGRTVRASIEARLAAFESGAVALMDFTGVGCIDFSCADEIVAKLLRGPVPLLLLVRGLADGHREALEPVLERAGLAVAWEQPDGTLSGLGARDSAAGLLEDLLARRVATRTPEGAFALARA